jgi:hypothetical protein
MLQVLVFYLSIVVHGQLREKENYFYFVKVFEKKLNLVVKNFKNLDCKNQTLA